MSFSVFYVSSSASPFVSSASSVSLFFPLLLGLGLDSLLGLGDLLHNLEYIVELVGNNLGLIWNLALSFFSPLPCCSLSFFFSSCSEADTSGSERAGTTLL